MNVTDIKAIAFDTGGTVLDWHSGICRALQAAGERRGLKADWHAVTNDYRRRAMKGIVGQIRPAFNMDDVHREALGPALEAAGLQALTAEDRADIFNAWHQLDAWPDFAAALTRLRQRYPVVSFTMLPTALVIDVSRRNGFVWDAVISCEMGGTYKPHRDAYLTTAQWLNLAPASILMVACHNFDLNAARAAGYRTAFVARPLEWGPEGPPDPVPNPAHDIIVPGFDALAQRLGA